MSVYVDDFKVTGPIQEIKSSIEDLKSMYKIKDLGPISNYFGMEVRRGADHSYSLSQTAKIDDVIALLELQNARPLRVPVPDDNRIDTEPEDLLNFTQAKLYRSAVGRLLHISLYTRPDIAYGVMRLTQKFASPTTNAFYALKALAKYLINTRSAALRYSPSTSTLLASSDSSWGTVSQAKATTGNMFMLNGSPIAWRSKRQSLTAQSTCEAEYVAAATAATQASWLLPLFNEMWCISHGPITLQMDNQAAIATAHSEGVTARNRHFLIRHSVLREALANKTIEIKYTPTDRIIADGLTKALQRQKHEDFLNLIKLIQHSD